MSVKITSLLISVVGFLFLTGQLVNGQEDDPVRVVWETYMSQRKGLDDLDVWLDKIIEVVDKNPQSPARFQVLYNLAGSCNSVRNFEKSAQLLERLVSMSPTPYWHLSALGDLGAVQKEIYLAAVRANDAVSTKKYADLTLQTYQQYHDELYSDETKAKLSSDQFFSLQRRLMQYLKTQSDLLRSVKKDPKSAVVKNDEAIKILESNPNLTRQSMGYDMALFQKDKAEALVGSINIDDAVKAMLEYGRSASEKDKIKSATARRFAEDTFPQKDIEYRKFLQLWLDSVPQDAETVVVLRDIGRSFFDEKKYTEAIDVLENIRNDWWQKVLTLDKIALEAQKGGYCSDVLDMLCRCYQATGLVEKSAQCIAELKKLVPHDSFIALLEMSQGQAEIDAARREVIEQMHASHASKTRRRTIVIVVNVILVSLIIYFILRRKRKK